MRESKQCVKDGYCYHCGKKLKAVVHLELNNSTGEFGSYGWDEDESQGWFDFGPDCAAKLDAQADKATQDAA
jgi:hypothetical protein